MEQMQPIGPPAPSPTRQYKREDIVLAVIHWGRHGCGGEPGLSLTREAGKLTEVLALMDFQKQSSVLVREGGQIDTLVCQAQRSVSAEGADPAGEEPSAAHVRQRNG